MHHGDTLVAHLVPTKATAGATAGPHPTPTPATSTAAHFVCCSAGPAPPRTGPQPADARPRCTAAGRVAPAAGSGDAPRVTLRVVDNEGKAVNFRMRRDHPMRKMAEHFCAERNTSVHQFEFRYKQQARRTTHDARHPPQTPAAPARTRSHPLSLSPALPHPSLPCPTTASAPLPRAPHLRRCGTQCVRSWTIVPWLANLHCEPYHSPWSSRTRPMTMACTRGALWSPCQNTCLIHPPQRF